MTALPIAFESNVGRYNFLGTTKLINAYAEKQGNDAKGPIAVLPCDGTLTLAEVTDTPCRGWIFMEDMDVAYSVHSSAVWKIDSSLIVTRIGTVPGIDIVQIVRNQKSTPQVGIKCDAGVYVVENDAVTKIDDEDLPSPVISIAQIGGYTIFAIDDSTWFISSINEMTEINGTDFATAEQSPDRNIRVWADRGELFIMGQKTIEPWKNTGNADFPFEPTIGSVVPRGIIAPDSVASFDNSFGWVGENRIVYKMNGYTPQRISNHDVERLIREDTAAEDIIGFSWSRGGHEFYNLTGSTWSKTYDAATGIWHDRESDRQDHWRHRFTQAAFGKIIIGDSLSGMLFYFDSNTYTEADDPLIWTVRSPPMHIFPNGGIVDALSFDLATGFGLVTSTDLGYDPLMMLRIYKDGGNSISFERQLQTGKRGNYRTRVRTRRLGKIGPQGMVIELAISDPVARSIVLADAVVRPLKLM